jgi:enolase
MKIKEAVARKIYNSNGEEAIEVEIRSEKAVAKGSCDAGTSTGSHEVNAYPKEGVDFIVDKFNKNISKQIVNLDISDFEDLEEVEKVFEIFDVTKDLKNIGGNIIIATEYAILKAVSKGEVWKFLNPKAKKVPGILANIVEGGKHIHGRGADFQEFLIVPKTKDISKAIKASVEVYNEAREELKKRDKDFSGNRSMEGGLVPNILNLEILNLLSKVCKKIGKKNRIEIGLGLDIAANDLWNGRRYEYKKFSKSESKKNLSKEEQIEYIRKLIKNYNLTYVEDPLEEEDFEGFRELNKGLGVICGDDLIVTDVERLKNAIRKISAVIIKPNQIGSLIKTKEAVDFAFKNKIMPVISHRSGATNDPIIAHLAVGWGLPLIKTGLMGGGRINRLNELIRISEKL